MAIACGGTGGHLFPGLAVAEVLQQWGCEIALMVSTKEVDQEAVKSAAGMRIIPLPAVALQNGRIVRFLQGFWQSYRLCRKAFSERKPQAVLAMGGFTSAPPVVAGNYWRASTFLHESNSIPGRANRWLAPWVDEVFVGFPETGRRLSNQVVRFTGTPVRPQFRPTAPEACRMALGLQPSQPVLLVMGGSQGARGINQLLQGALPELTRLAPELQYLHLTGPDDVQTMQAAYAQHGRRAVVRPFLTEMDLALGAASLAVNRAGASSLAELAAMQTPSILVPYPHATDNHQFHNARAFADSGAALLLEQTSTSPAQMAATILELLRNSSAQASMRQALARWHFPAAAEEIAAQIFARVGLVRPETPTEAQSYTLPRTTSLGRSPLRKPFVLAAPGGKAP